MVLEEAAARLRSAIARSKEFCDRSRVFSDGRLDCSLVVSDLLFWSGVLPYASPARSRRSHPEQHFFTRFGTNIPRMLTACHFTLPLTDTHGLQPNDLRPSCKK